MASASPISEQSAAARKLARQLGSRRPGETVPLHELMVSGKRQRRPPRTVDELTDCASGKEQAELMLAIKNSKSMQRSMRQGIDLPEAPVFRPNAEQFADPMAYIKSIREQAEPFGICRVVPPAGWNPPLAINKDTFRFHTRTQDIDKLQEATGFDSGGWFTFNEFQQFADEFKQKYVAEHGANLSQSPSAAELEREYWRLVETSCEPVSVRYGSDISAQLYGSGFPQTSDKDPSLAQSPFATHGWNLNVMPTYPGSVLQHIGSAIDGVTRPWVYVGMLFSSFCWHVEDDFMYSINYHHFGAPKQWYGAPSRAADEFQAVMRESVPKLFEDEPDLLYQLVTQLSPALFVDRNVPIFKTLQESGEFVITFPKAFHAGFSHGFNCGEAVNFATEDWLHWGRQAAKKYKPFARETTFSVDFVLLQCILSASARKCFNPQTLLNDLKVAKRDEDNAEKEARRLRSAVELMSDAERSAMAYIPQCCVCRTYLFMSYSQCSCSSPSASNQTTYAVTLPRVPGTTESAETVVNLSHFEAPTCFADLPLIQQKASKKGRMSADIDTNYGTDFARSGQTFNPNCLFYCWSHVHAQCVCSLDHKRLRQRFSAAEYDAMIKALETGSGFESLEHLLPAQIQVPKEPNRTDSPLTISQTYHRETELQSKTEKVHKGPIKSESTQSLKQEAPPVAEAKPLESALQKARRLPVGSELKLAASGTVLSVTLIAGTHPQLTPIYRAELDAGQGQRCSFIVYKDNTGKAVLPIESLQ